MIGRNRTPREAVRRLALALAALAVLVYAVQGGEWGTLDLVQQSHRLARLQRDVDSLTHRVDSLTRYRKAIQTDPAAQERVAREEFGMVRGNKELLYRFAEPERDSEKRGKRP